MRITTIFVLAGAVAMMAGTIVTADAQRRGRGRGMPAEAMETIHGLFDAHDEVRRTVKQTDDGYVSRTVSKNAAVAKLLQTHVKQMEERLKQGLMVRRWDPAYEEFVNHYDDIDIKITDIDNGISITAVGKTEDAKKVARNHAGIISKFVNDGWAEHDKAHPAVLAKREIGGAAGDKPCCLKADKGGEECAECTQKGAGKAVPAATEKAETKPCCKELGKEGKVCAKCAEPTDTAEKKERCPEEAEAAEGKACCKDEAQAERGTETNS